MSNRLAFGLLGVACIAAAAGGGYLATRQNAVPVPAAAQVQAVPTSTAPAAASTPAPVQETEALVGDPAKPSAAAAAPSKSAKRSDAPARTQTPQAAKTQTARRADPPALTSSWPSGAQPPAAAPLPSAPEPTIEDHTGQEPARPAEPPKPAFEELVIARDSVIGLQLDNRVSSETARVEDRVDAHVVRDVRVGDRVAIPAGSRVIGSVTQVDRGGKFKEQARLGLRFHTIVMADGSRLPISTETIVRLGDAPGNGSAAKIGGGAVGGAILGAILGGAKGAAIGATAGGGAGTAAVMAGDRSAVVLTPGMQLTPRMLSPVTVTVDRERDEEQ
jgi:type IV secretory pathway VirB10-like protein